MSTETLWPVPSWVSDLPDVERDSARTRYLLGLAAAYLCERGNLSKLARALNCPIATLHSAVDRGQISGELAVTIERALGRRHFPRELLRPDLFIIPVED